MNRAINFFTCTTSPACTPEISKAGPPGLILVLLACYLFAWSGITAVPGHDAINTVSAVHIGNTLAEVHSRPGQAARDKDELASPQPEEKTVSMSAYTSREEETDSTPCISADGTNICKYDGCIVASNDYPFDTVLDIEGFGECVVKDRMSSRYTGTGNMDLYFGQDLQGALEFGRQNLKIKITS